MAQKPTYDDLEQKIKALEKRIVDLEQYEKESCNVRGFFNSIIKDAPVFLVALNPEGEILLMNETMLNFLECSMDEVQGKNLLLNFVPDDDREIVSKIFQQLIGSKGPTLNSNRIIAKDGRKLLLEWHGRQVFKENGALDYFWCLGIGITMRKKREEELAASEEKLDSIIRTIPDIIYRLDADGHITFISDSVKRYGYKPEDLSGTYLLDIVHPDDRETVARKINERRTGGRSSKSFEVRLLKNNQGKSASEYFLISAEGLYTSETPGANTFIGTQGIARDISVRKHARVEQLHREKLQAIIEMAGAVCHEMSQPLMAISGYSKLISMKTSENDLLNDKIVKLLNQIDRLGEITQKLMRITKYETKDYLEGKIIDIDKATE